MSYTRLTVRHPNSDYIAINETKQLQDSEQAKKVLNRLAELEDKIEQGTLIELPCKVGDLIYFVSKKNGIQWTTINEIKIHIDFTGIVCIEVRDDDYKWHTVNNRTVFLTREEAEKRLKEIQK